jgi:hypothetical protein
VYDPVFCVNGMPENGTQRLICIAFGSASIYVKVFVRQQRYRRCVNESPARFAAITVFACRFDRRFIGSRTAF